MTSVMLYTKEFYSKSFPKLILSSRVKADCCE